MLGPLVIYPLFVAICVAGVFRPWIGLVGFYGCVMLEPSWNWRWSIPADFPFQKYIAFSVLAGCLLTGFRGNRFSAHTYAAVGCLVTFLALAFLSSLQSIDSDASAFHLDNMWKIVLMAVLAVILLDEPRKIWICLVTLFLMQGYSAFRINEQYFSDGFSMFVYQAWGTKGDNNLYSNLTVPIIACSASVCIFTEKIWLRAAAGIIFVLQLHQLMLLESRGAMLAAIVMLGIFAWFMPKNRFTINAAVAGVLVAFVLAGPSVVKEFTSAFETGDNRDASAESRFELWKAGYKITADYPLLGVGPYAAERLVPSYYEGQVESSRKALHNLFFEISTGCGLPATLLYFSFFLIPWYRGFRTITAVNKDPHSEAWYRASLLAVVAGIPGYLIASMFSSGALLETPYVIASLALAAECVVRQSAGYQEMVFADGGSELSAGTSTYDYQTT